MNKLQKFRNLSTRRKCLFLAAFPVLIVSGLLLFFIGYQRCRSLLAFGRSTKTQNREPGVQQMEKARETAEMVRVAVSNFPFRITCLVESMALSCLLDWQGIPNEIQIGVRTSEQQLQAHAWVEYNGRALLSEEQVRVYERLEPSTKINEQRIF